jgi:hypothetical protein
MHIIIRWSFVLSIREGMISSYLKSTDYQSVNVKSVIKNNKKM